MPETITYPKGTLIHCNRCDAKFKAPVAFVAPPLSEQRTTDRLFDFFTCPNCGMTDSHWLYWKDLQEARLYVSWLARDNKRGRYVVYLLKTPPADLTPSQTKEWIAFTKANGVEIAQFKAQGDAFAYARQAAEKYGKTNPDYHAIVVI